ncbi:MAG TPA: T9SS type A sorting domain-containing protein [Bacteroidales bacterium]|nr:T9SS type A sorting domain-containing protein [Bacteroidales bacterium]
MNFKKAARIICFIILLIMVKGSQSQNWLPLDKGIGKTWADIRQIFPDSNLLYVTGSFTEDGNNIPMRGIAKWDGIKWDSVGDANKYNATKFDLCKYNDTLIISSNFMIPSHEHLAKFTGLIWDTIPNSRDLNTTCFLEKNGILYFGGGFDKCGNDSTFGLGKFNGTTFSGLTPCYDTLSSQIFSLAFFQDTLYVGGVFYLYPQLPIAGLAKWDGTNLLPVSSEFLNSTCGVFSMVVYQNELFIGGGFQKSDGFTGNNIMRWDGHNFYEVGGGTNNTITSMKVYNNELYIGGRFTEVDDNPCQNIAKWNGSQWTCLNNDVFDYFINVRDICIYKDELYVAGIFRKIGNDSISSIAKYNHPLTSVTEYNKENAQLIVYPNPVTGNEFTISFPFTKSGTLQVINVLGETVISNNIRNAAKFIINVEALSKGCYIIKVQADNKCFAEKILKQ